MKTWLACALLVYPSFCSLGLCQSIEQKRAIADLTSDSRVSRTKAVKYLAEHYENSKSFLLELLVSDDEEVLRGVSTVIQSVGSRAAPDLAKSLASAKGTQKRNLIRVLGELGMHARAALAAIHKELGNEDKEVRLASIEALDAIGSPDSVAQLSARLRDEDSEVRLAVIGALGNQERRELAIPEIIAALKTNPIEEYAFHRAAVTTLASTGGKVIPTLEREIRNTENDRTLRLSFVYTLGIIGEHGKAGEVLPAIPILRKLIAENDGDFRRCALSALFSISSIRSDAAVEQEIRELLTTNLTGFSAYERVLAARIAICFADHRKFGIRILNESVSNADAAVADLALHDCNRLKGAVRLLTFGLLRALQHADEKVRLETVKTISRPDLCPHLVLPAVCRTALFDKSCACRRRAIFSILVLAPGPIARSLCGW